MGISQESIRNYFKNSERVVILCSNITDKYLQIMTHYKMLLGSSFWQKFSIFMIHSDLAVINASSSLQGHYLNSQVHQLAFVLLFFFYMNILHSLVTLEHGHQGHFFFSIVNLTCYTLTIYKKHLQSFCGETSGNHSVLNCWVRPSTLQE